MESPVEGSSSRSNCMASAEVKTSSMYRKSIQRTNSSGVISDTTCQTGLWRVFAHRSQRALTRAPSAMWITPFSGPIHRNWLSEFKYRHVLPQFADRVSNSFPTTIGARLDIAAHTTSVPRPSVNVFDTGLLLVPSSSTANRVFLERSYHTMPHVR